MAPPPARNDSENREITLAIISEKIDALTDRVDWWTQRVVTKERIWPVEALVYGATGFILLAVLTAVVALVIVKA